MWAEVEVERGGGGRGAGKEIFFPGRCAVYRMICLWCGSVCVTPHAIACRVSPRLRCLP